MKNLKNAVAVVAIVVGMVALARAGEYFIDYLKSDVVIVMRTLGIGTMSPSGDYKVDMLGNARIVGNVTLTGAPAITGAPTVVGSVLVSTSASSLQSNGLYGSVVTLSTQPTAVGQIWYQVSDNKLYVSTRVPVANVTYCAATGCYAALH
jgi:hypothetical protein